MRNTNKASQQRTELSCQRAAAAVQLHPTHCTGFPALHGEVGALSPCLAVVRTPKIFLQSKSEAGQRKGVLY